MAGTVLLTGASGLLGTWLRRSAPRDVELVSMVHRRSVAGDAIAADLRDRRAVETAFKAVRPGLVIHAGFARDEASIVDATRHLAEVASDVGRRACSGDVDHRLSAPLSPGGSLAPAWLRASVSVRAHHASGR
ncbi:MAG: sugar nucleotide-binding protein, partial [Iamia sp.]